MKSILMLGILAILAVIILVVVGNRGTGVFKKQGVAWGLTVLMIFAAIGIGYARAPVNNPAHSPDYPPETAPPAGEAQFYVWDRAGALSNQTELALSRRNQRLNERYGVVVGVLACNYGKSDLGDYAMEWAGDMGLGGYDMIVALDISGDNYWLVQGDKLTRDFTDQMCSDYAYDYMEDYFARGMYDDAVLALTEALEVWYADYYG